jgi:hypothetical protein
MLIQLTHPEPNYEFWIDDCEITVMERYNRPPSMLITMNDDRPNVTALVLKSGKIMSCKETPSQIFEIMKNAKPPFVVTGE